MKCEVSIPEELKYVLVSDWDLLTHKKSLFALPAKITVANILSEYVKNAEKLAAGNQHTVCVNYKTSDFSQCQIFLRYRNSNA